ncbi:MAG: hypothetical protein HOH43_11780, partial [Candidatus Latescibacteria bacterium]|nr:hypothetical protein [Candidatus Latescibacterota bacterium]
MTKSRRISHMIFGLTGLCLFVGLYAAPGPSQAQGSKEVVRSVALRSGGRVSIETFKGSVTVSAWDKSEVEIRAIVEPDGRSRIREEAVEYTEILIDDSPGSVFIESDYGGVQRNLGGDDGWGDGNSVTLPFVHYTIRIPKDARLNIDDHKSEISIDGLA